MILSSHVTVDNLNDIMEFNHVIEVHADGTVTEPRDLHAPAESLEHTDGDDYADQLRETLYVAGVPYEDRPVVQWTLMDGYSGQDGYRGPVMHASEYIGGGMARDILATPGLYVALTVECERTEEDPDPAPAGWVVATRPRTPEGR